MRLLVLILLGLISSGTAFAQDKTLCVKEASELAIDAITTKNYLPVIQKATECIRKHPDVYSAYSFRGNAYLGKGDLDLAIADFSKFIGLQTEDLEWYKKEFGAAAKGSDYVKDGTESLIYEFYSRSRAYVKKNDIEKARADLSAALALEPARWETKQKLAELDKLAAQPKLSLSTTVSQTPEQLAAHGRRQAGQKDYDGAIKSFTECLTAKPDFVACYALRGSSYGFKGSMDLAMLDFDKALKMSPSEPRIYLIRAAMFAELGKKEQAIADFRAALKIDPGSTPAKQGIQKLGEQP